MDRDVAALGRFGEGGLGGLMGTGPDVVTVDMGGQWAPAARSKTATANSGDGGALISSSAWNMAAPRHAC